MDRGTEVPILNTRVRLIEITYNGFSNPSKRVIQSAISDAKGQFAFDFQWAEGLSYEVDAIPNNYQTYYEVPIVKGDITQGQTNKVDCFLNPYSWVKYRVRNVNPLNEKDSISFLGGTFSGKDVDKTIVVKTAKLWSRPDSVYWSVIRNSVWTKYSKPITIIPKDTVSFEINY